MDAISQAQRAYSTSAQQHLQTSRSAEYQAFSEIIRRLRSSATAADRSFSDLVAAIHDNRALWTILASDVATANNGLPEELRAQIFYLAEFTDEHSRKVLRGEGKVDVLIEINTAVMRGLAGAPKTSERQS